MIEESFSIQAIVHLDGADDLAADARARYKDRYPGRSARRMTHLGMMMGICIDKMDVQQRVPVIYASAFGESESLEKFIDSFPQASPALFQSSIHPSAVEQALIPDKRAIDRFYPITSSTNLLGQALEKCFILGEDDMVVVGGEERGTWLTEFQLASGESFAFGIRLCRGDEGIGRISLDRSEPPSLDESLPFAQSVQSLGERKSIRVPSFALDAWMRIDWE